MKLARFALTPPLVAISVALFAALGARGDVVYVNSAAVGGAGDGTSWADAYTRLEDAIANLTASRTVYVAQGMYQITEAIALTSDHDGLTIYGGFPGVSDAETLDDRDPTLYQTIFYGYKKSDLSNVAWSYSVPGQNIQYLSTPVFSGSRLNLQETSFADDYYGVWQRQWQDGSGYFCSTFLKITDAKVTCDGLTIAAFRSYASPVHISGTTKPVAIRNCLFVANTPQYGCIRDESTRTGALTVEGCTFLWNSASSSPAATSMQVRGPTAVTGCRFIGSSGGGKGGVIHHVSGRLMISDCDFTRNSCGSSDYWAEFESNGRGGLISFAGGTFLMENCSVTNNRSTSAVSGSSATQKAAGMPLISANNGILRSCLFANNYVSAKANDGVSYLMIRPSNAGAHLLVDGCAFVSNSLAISGYRQTPCSTAIAVVGNRYGTTGSTAAMNHSVTVANCTFLGNAATAAAPAEGGEATVLLCRGALHSCCADGQNSSVGVVNCTFAGDAEEGVCEVAQFGGQHTKPFNIVNSLFLASSDYARIFSFTNPELVNLACCTVVDQGGEMAGVASVTGHDGDGVPLVAAANADGRVIALRPDALTPGLRVSADVATNAGAFFAPTLAYRPPEGSWTKLTPAATATVLAEPEPIADGFGDVRTFGAVTRGATQLLSEKAENGCSLTIRRQPVTAGTVSSPSTQSVAAGDPIVPVIASPAAGVSFLGWFDEEGVRHSDDPTLAIASLDADTVLTARFGTPPVDITFRLEGAGVFVENGKDEITKRYESGSSPFLPPAYVVDDENWIVYGFDLPTEVPMEDATYVARTLTKAVRVVRVVPPGTAGGGKKDGTSWADAYDNLQAAVNDAGRYRGEVWMKEGTYYLAQPVDLLSNVALRGGFAGTEDSADESDPKAHPTILTGQSTLGLSYRRNMYETWFNETQAPVAGPVWDSDGNFVQPEAREGLIWNPYSAGTATYGLRQGESATVTNAVIAGLTFTAFRYNAVQLLAGSDARISDCRFLANATAYDAQYAAVSSAGAVRLSDCEFVANLGALRTAGSAAVAGASNLVERCRFFRNTQATAVVLGGATPTVVRNCTFSEQASSWSAGVASTLSVGGSSRSVEFDDCLFADNAVYTNSTRNITIDSSTARVAFNRCTFRANVNRRGNLAISSAQTRSGVIAHVHGDLRLRDCLFTGNRCEIAASAVANALAACVALPTASWSETLSTNVLTAVNTTFADNAVVSPDAANLAAAIYFYAGSDTLTQYRQSLALVHCIFHGNALEGASGKVAEVLTGQQTGGRIGIWFVNSVLDSSEHPGLKTLSGIPTVVNSTIAGFDASAYRPASGYDCLTNFSAKCPSVYRRLRPGANGMRHLPICVEKPYSTAAAAVHEVGGEFYVKLSDNWPDLPYRRIKAKVYGLSAEAAAEAGIDDGETIPDGYGLERTVGFVALGPVAPYGCFGFQLLVR